MSNKATPQINQNRDIIHCINNSQQLNEKNSLNSSPNLNISYKPNEDLNEMEILENYIKNANITAEPTESGLYFIEKNEGSGDYIKQGDEIPCGRR